MPIGPPDALLKVVLGEVAAVITNGQKVLPAKALALGYAFRYPELAGALREIFSRKPSQVEAAGAPRPGGRGGSSLTGPVEREAQQETCPERQPGGHDRGRQRHARAALDESSQRREPSGICGLIPDDRRLRGCRRRPLDLLLPRGIGRCPRLPRRHRRRARPLTPNRPGGIGDG